MRNVASVYAMCARVLPAWRRVCVERRLLLQSSVMYQIITLHIPLRLFFTGSGIGADGATALAEALRVNASLTTLGVTGGSYAVEGTTMPVGALMCKV